MLVEVLTYCLTKYILFSYKQLFTSISSICIISQMLWVGVSWSGQNGALCYGLWCLAHSSAWILSPSCCCFSSSWFCSTEYKWIPSYAFNTHPQPWKFLICLASEQYFSSFCMYIPFTHSETEDGLFNVPSSVAVVSGLVTVICFQNADELQMFGPASVRESRGQNIHSEYRAQNKSVSRVAWGHFEGLRKMGCSLGNQLVVKCGYSVQSWKSYWFPDPSRLFVALSEYFYTPKALCLCMYG